MFFCRTGQLISEHAKCTYPILFIIAFVCLSVHTLYFDADQFSIKLFSFIYFTVSVVRRRNEYQIVIETQSID